MSKADKMLWDLGFRPIKRPFSDWHPYMNKLSGVTLTFMDDFKVINFDDESVLDVELLQALLEKTKELGWLDE